MMLMPRGMILPSITGSCCYQRLSTRARLTLHETRDISFLRHDEKILRDEALVDADAAMPLLVPLLLTYRCQPIGRHSGRRRCCGIRRERHDDGEALPDFSPRLDDSMEADCHSVSPIFK